MTRQAPSALWALRDDRTLSAYAKLAYVMLWTRLPDSRPSMSTLAADMNASVRKARDAVRELERAGVLKTLPRVSEQGDSDTNRYELLSVIGAAQSAVPPGTECRTGAASDASKDINPKTASEGREKSRASRRARPAVTRAEAIQIVRDAASESGDDVSDEEDLRLLDVYARFVLERKTDVPIANTVKYLAGIFASFPSFDGVLSNTPEYEW